MKFKFILIFVVLLVISIFLIQNVDAASNGIDSYTKLALHLDGTDTSTNDADFVDSSTEGHTITQEGSAALDASPTKFGGTSVSTASGNSVLHISSLIMNRTGDQIFVDSGSQLIIE